jgi:hypothetical protein
VQEGKVDRVGGGGIQEHSLPSSAIASSSAMRFNFHSDKKMGYGNADWNDLPQGRFSGGIM